MHHTRPAVPTRSRSDDLIHGVSMDQHMRELPGVDDLEVVAEIAEAELAELRKITQAVDVLREQRARSQRVAFRSPLKRDDRLVSLSLTCTGDVVHVQISTRPQVRPAASELPCSSDQPNLGARMDERIMTQDSVSCLGVAGNDA